MKRETVVLLVIALVATLTPSYCGIRQMTYDIKFTTQIQYTGISGHDVTFVTLHHVNSHAKNNHINPIPDFPGLKLLSKSDTPLSSNYVLRIDPSLYKEGSVIVTGHYEFTHEKEVSAGEWKVYIDIFDS